MVLTARLVPKSYKEDNWNNQVTSLRHSEENSQRHLIKGQQQESWKGAVNQRGLRAVAEESPL
jgi:hypothetical protein